MNGEKRILGERRVVLGRSKDCDVQVPDANVSRRHAELRQEGASYWVVDLDSTNGIEVNGKRVPAREARGRRHDHGRLDRPRLRPAARTVSNIDVDDGAAGPEDRVPRPPLPLHLADRAQREPRPPHCPRRRAMIIAPGAGGGRRPRAACAGRCAARRRQEPGARRGRGDPARRRRPSRSAAAGRTTCRSTATSSPRPSTRASSRVATGLGRGHRLDQRHVRQRCACDDAAPPWQGRHGPRRRDRFEVRRDERSAAPRASRTPAARAAGTRTPTSASRRSSRSRTGWAARRPARSPRGSLPRRCRRRTAPS